MKKINLEDKRILLCDGDSWTSGIEINPDIPESAQFPSHPANYEYRIQRVWPKYFSDYVKFDKVYNLSVPGSSNDGIFRRVLFNIPTLLRKYDPSQILVIIGWSSPERKDFFYKPIDQPSGYWETIYPAEFFKNEKPGEFNDFLQLYVSNFWNEEEYVTRHVTQVISLHHYLKSNNIDHIFFDAFYESEKVIIENLDLLLNDHNLLSSIDSHVFVSHDESLGYYEFNALNQYKNIYENHYIPSTFQQFLKKYSFNGSDREKYFKKYHPTKLSHRLWARFLYKQLTK